MTKRCKNCNSELNNDYNFCPYCGVTTLDIQNGIIAKLAFVIDYNIFSKFSTVDMQNYKFIPINAKDNYLFVAIKTIRYMAKIKEVIDLPYEIKFLYLQEADFDELLNLAIKRENLIILKTNTF